MRAPDSRTLNILLAEDNPVNQKVMTHLLGRQEGHHVVVAENGREAVETAEKQRFDLILMDVQMPVMSGLEATVILRRRERTAGARTPIIALTAYAMNEDRDRCLSVGMDGYLSKPIDEGALLAQIEEHTRG